MEDSNPLDAYSQIVTGVADGTCWPQPGVCVDLAVGANG